MRNKNQLLIIIGILSIIIACKKADDVGKLDFLTFKKPEHFPEPIYQFDQTLLKQETFALGKQLFFDPILSRNHTISCASCHIPQNSFTHHGHDLSHGIDDQLGIRNSMPLMNLAWSNSFFWDGGVHDLDMTSMVPIENPIEMDEKLSNIVTKLNVYASYPELFKKAYGSNEITSAKIMKALGYYMALLVSDNAKYDHVKEGKATFTTTEWNGYKLYQDNCSSCHTEPLFTDYSFRNNGIGIGPLKDLGRFSITQNEADKLKFKVPSLRNLKYTAPYMHDGRFYTLRSVINHYSSEIIENETLDPLLKSTNKIVLNENQINDLLDFLNTLNDEQFINNKLFAEQ